MKALADRRPIGANVAVAEEKATGSAALAPKIIVAAQQNMCQGVAVKKFKVAALILAQLLLAGSAVAAAISDGAAAAADGVTLQIGDNGYLVADELYCSHGVGEAVGSVRLSAADGFLLAERLRYQLADGNFFGTDVRFRIKNIYVRADSVEGVDVDGQRHIIFRGGRIYGGEPGPHSPNIAAEKITIPAAAVAWIDGASLCLGERRIFSTGRWRLKLDGIAMCFRGKYGYGKDLGVYGRNSVACGVGKTGTVGLNLDIYGKRGPLVGPCCRWDGDLAANGTVAEIFGGLIRDRGDRGVDLLSAPIPVRRGFLRAAYGRRFGDNWSICGEMNRWSDSFVLRDFRPEKYWNDQYPSSHAEVARQWANSLATATLRWDPNDFCGPTKNFHEIRYQIVPTKLVLLPVLWEASVAAVGWHPEGDRQKALGDLFCGLGAPIVSGGAFSCRPFAACRSLVGGGDGGRYHSEIWQAGFDLAVVAEGDIEASVGRWDIGSLRHRMMPLLCYRRNWRRGRGDCVDLGTFGSGTLPIIDICECRAAGSFADGHCVRIGLENVIQARSVADGLMRTVAEVHLYEDFRWRVGADGRERPQIYGALRFNPADFFSMRLCGRASGDHLSAEELRIDGELHDGNVWAMSFCANYLRNCARQLGLGFDFQITSRSRIGTSLRYDARLRKITSQRHHLSHRFDRNWSMDVRLTVRAAASGIERRNLRFGIHLDY
ncbi:MAG: hypothetical protein LBI39_04680 [Puniceicoccales bacterium]|nr:hypothetical protein [Puniceicoccales bacterium]